MLRLRKKERQQLKAAKASNQEITAAVSELKQAKENVLRLEERSKLGPRIPRKDDGTIAFETDFFKRQAFLAVSGQLQVDTCALSNVYNFGLTLRAENGADSYVQYLCKWLL